MSKIREIATKRWAIQSAKELIKNHQELLEESEIYQTIQKAKEQLAKFESDLQTVEDAYRVECIGVYSTTGEKVQPGGQVKIYTVLDFDQEQARTWAIEHNHAALLKLNTSEFKKVAKTLKPDFVTITEEPKMTLARDLNKFLEEDLK